MNPVKVMKFWMSTFLLLISFVGFPQQQTIEIQLKSGQKIQTRWLELKEVPLLQKPFLWTDILHTKKIKLEDVDFYQGYDQDGNYQYLVTYQYGYLSDFALTERLFSIKENNQVILYYDQLTFLNGSKFKRQEKYKYSFHGQAFKPVNFQNVTADFGMYPSSQKHIQKASYLRTSQLITMGIGLAFFFDVLVSNDDPTKEDFMNRQSSQMLMASGLCLMIPVVLEFPKQKQLVKAVQAYQE